MADKLPWWGPARPPFLLVTPACIGLAVAACWWVARQTGHSWAWFDAALVLLGALLAHVGVNALNEFGDFNSGLDSHTQRTPFSGGSGVLPAHPELARVALWMGCGSLVCAMLIGWYFLLARPAMALPLIPVGLAGLALAVAYTPWVTRHPWLCLMAPGFGVGPLMMLGTSAVLLGTLSGPVALLSLLPFGLGNNLLLLNQYPDVDADRGAGRLTLPILLGAASCWPVLLSQYALAYGALLAAVWLAGLPWGACLGLLTLPVALAVVRGASQHASNIPALLPFMGMNVAVSLLTPVLAAVGIVLTA
jgi:1,4-dihydroxy-2-naphthoate octaprenyltransferase